MVSRNVYETLHCTNDILIFLILIDGKKFAAELREELKKEVLTLKSKYNKVPGLTVILIGDLTPSQIYVRNKEKSAKEVGLKSDILKYPDSVEEKVILDNIEELARLECMGTGLILREIKGFHILRAAYNFVLPIATACLCPPDIIFTSSSGKVSDLSSLKISLALLNISEKLIIFNIPKFLLISLVRKIFDAAVKLSHNAKSW